MIKKIIILTNLLVLLVSGQIFAQMRELTLSERIENAKLIFEGKVIRKTCFWNAEHTMIFTSNTIEIYKTFKGDFNSSEINIRTEGGQVGDEIHSSSHELDLKEGDVGVFMVEYVAYSEETVLMKFLRVYGGPQGFIKYDLLEKTASDPFKKYNSVADVYKAITDMTCQSYKVIKPFSMEDPDGTNSKKERCRWKCCKKKNKKKKSQ